MRPFNGRVTYESVQTQDLDQDIKKVRKKGMPCCLLILLIVIAFAGYLVFSYNRARNRGLAATERLYSALRNADERVVKSSVTGTALDKLDELEAEYGKVLSYEITDTAVLPEDLWTVHLRVTRERARTVETVSNVGSGLIIQRMYGKPDSE